ncbi:MAG TPA: DoxX family protein [Tepidisphaeraceae bacterium]|nr:DoxX family protein [Tepidisphaeraceae bacterium]
MARNLKPLLFGGAGGASTFADLGLLLLRVTIGTFMAFGHGMGKLPFLGGELPVGGVTKLGFPAPTLFAWLLALTEFVGGLLLAIGLLTRPAAFAIMFGMGVAAFVAHGNDPWFARGGPSKEMAMLFLVPALLFVLAGAGRFSIDALFNRKR